MGGRTTVTVGVRQEVFTIVINVNGLFTSLNGFLELINFVVFLVTVFYRERRNTEINQVVSWTRLSYVCR